MTNEEVEIIEIVFQSYLNIVKLFKKPNYISEEVVTEVRDKLIKELEQTRWTPVSERLPKANGRYYVTRGLNACGALWNKVYIVNYSDLMGLKSERIWWDGNVGKSDFERFDDVLAWMPLPLPYKEEQDVKNNTDND